jgi:hypothetical protein
MEDRTERSQEETASATAVVNLWSNRFRVVFVCMASLLLFSSLLRGGSWVGVIYDGGIPMALAILLCLRRNRSSPINVFAHRFSLSTWLRLLVAGFVISILLLAGISWLQRIQSPSVDVRGMGVAMPGEYRNHYFGFRLGYTQEWQDVTEEAQMRGSEQLSGSTATVLLALARKPTDNPEDSASVMLAVEAVPESARGLTSAAYLNRMVSTLKKRADAPRDVQWEPKIVIAGHVFDRLSLRRPWGDGELNMMYWAAIQRGYVVNFTGCYGTGNGLKSIEDLLVHMSRAKITE